MSSLLLTLSFKSYAGSMSNAFTRRLKTDCPASVSFLTPFVAPNRVMPSSPRFLAKPSKSPVAPIILPLPYIKAPFSTKSVASFGDVVTILIALIHSHKLARKRALLAI